jgi:hypothetical protein
MSKNIKLVTSLSLTALLAGCGSTLPLTFADKTSVGVDISASEQGAELAVGFKTKSLALVPIAVRTKDSSGHYTKVNTLQAEDGTKKDAYSTFGNFTLDSQGEAGTASVSVGLGRFFATGVAAQKISEEIGKAMVEKAKK